MRRFKIILIIIVSLAITSCKTVNPEEDAVRKSIGRYNLAIVIAYRDLNMEPLKAVTIEAHSNKVNSIIEAYLSGDEIMDSELLKLTFNDIKIEENKAEAVTSEDWKFRWVNIKTREEVEPLKDIHYEMLYHLVKKDGKWLVEKVEEAKEVGR
ncbi:MAG: hypothetical protein WA162_06005 [Thermodesulfobacteriota bacterium]